MHGMSILEGGQVRALRRNTTISSLALSTQVLENLEREREDYMR